MPGASLFSVGGLSTASRWSARRPDERRGRLTKRNCQNAGADVRLLLTSVVGSAVALSVAVAAHRSDPASGGIGGARSHDLDALADVVANSNPRL